jgi:prepilin-type N-terminal cleavage/methylation domain-containing protein
MTRRINRNAERKGVTLIELLVVATIMLTLAAVSVPAIKPMMESQATSNAAQTVATYLERAKARAMTTGRSCGVTFEYFDGTFEYFDGTYNEDEAVPRGSAALILRQVEEPPFFSGFSFGSTVSVAPNVGHLFSLNAGNNPYYGMRINQLVMANENDSDPDDSDLFAYFAASLATSDDGMRIQFNSTGPFYPLILEDDGGYYIVKIPGVELPVHNRASYKVASAPIATMTSPVGLAQGTVVDLEFSGTDDNFFALGEDVTVMFTPSGEVDYILDGNEKRTPSNTLYFLLGRWDRISALGVSEDGYSTIAEDQLWNFEDGANFWVAINPQTGVISTAEVNQPFTYAPVDWTTIQNGKPRDAFKDGVVESREFARYSKRNIGGR